jgi:hypothetical protein
LHREALAALRVRARFKVVLDAIRELMEPEQKPGRRIGFE